MKTVQIARKTNNFRVSFVLFAAMVLGLLCNSAFGHEWTINGKKVKAKAVDFSGTHIVLEDKQGKRKTIALNELAAQDLQYVTNLLSIRNAEIQKQLERRQIQQQQMQLLSQFVDVWTVRMVAPNGTVGWRNYFAANSLHAKQLAFQEFGNVRVIGVHRLRRPGVFGRGGNVGWVPTVSQIPVFPTILFRN